MFVGITAVNPTTVVYFAAVVLGNRHLVATPAQGAVFVTGRLRSPRPRGSSCWPAAAAALGRVATGRRGHVVTGLVSAAVIAALAVRTMLA